MPSRGRSPAAAEVPASAGTGPMNAAPMNTGPMNTGPMSAVPRTTGPVSTGPTTGPITGPITGPGRLTRPRAGPPPGARPVTTR